MPIAQSPCLTELDFSILEFIETCVETRGYPPSVREICNHAELSSTSSGHHRLRKLERAGWIRRAHKCSRGITLVADGPAETPERAA